MWSAKRKSGWTAVFAALVVTAAACSSGGSSSGSSPTDKNTGTAANPDASSGVATGAPATNGASGGEIPVGALNPLTGSGSTYGPGMQAAIQIAVDEINAAGGPLDRKIKLYTADAQSNPNDAVTAAHKLIDVNKVMSILGTYASPVTLAVQPVAIQSNVILMNTSGAPAVSTKGPLSFQFNPRDVLYGAALAKLAQDKGYKTAAILTANNPATLEIADSFADRFKAAGGKITTRVDYQQNQTSYRAEINKALGSKPDVVMLGSYTPDAIVIMKEAHTVDSSMHWIGDAFGINEALAKAVGTAATNGMIGVDSVANKDADAYKNLASKYQAKTQKDLASNVYAAMTYDMANMLALAIQKAGATDTAAVAKAMHEISESNGTAVSNFADGLAALKSGKTINYEGASGPLAFNETNNRDVYFGVFELQNGKSTLIETIPPSSGQ